MKVTVDLSKFKGSIKPMNAVNNGPHVRYSNAEGSKQVAQFKEMNIPLVRNHDASFNAYYGGPHTVDVGSDEPLTLSRLDGNSPMTPCEILYPCDGRLTVTMAVNSAILLKK